MTDFGPTIDGGFDYAFVVGARAGIVTLGDTTVSFSVSLLC